MVAELTAGDKDEALAAARGGARGRLASPDEPAALIGSSSRLTREW